ncbi:hypothetical protein BJQ93_01200 [Bacillus subtilis]|nr:hypothetical protein [Bacillus subtilis]
MIKLKKAKLVKVMYFKDNGDFYLADDELIADPRDYEELVEVIKTRRRFKGMTTVISDGGDGVYPYVKPRLIKDDTKEETRGFFG